MSTPEDRLTEAFDRRAATFEVEDRLDAIVDGVAVTHAETAPERRNWRLLSAAAAVLLLVVGAFAIARVGNFDQSSDDGNAVREDAPDDGIVLPVTLSSVDELADDEWVIPVRLPDGFEFRYASNYSGPRPTDRPLSVQYGIGSSQSEQIEVRVLDGISDLDGESLDVDGVAWTVRSVGSTRLAARRLGDVDVMVVIMGAEGTELPTLLSDLGVVAGSALPQPPISFGDSMTEVGVFDVDGRELTVKADGSNGWFCVGLFFEDDVGDGQCASFFDPANLLEEQQSAGATFEDSETFHWTSGLTSADAARIDVEWIDGTVTSVVPENTSDRFPGVLFWATGTTIEPEPGQSSESTGETLVEVRAFDADGELLATSRGGVLTVE